MNTANKLIGAFVPGLPHILNPDLNAHYGSLNAAMGQIGKGLKIQGARRILYYSTQWLSVLGHSVQTRPRPTGRHIDENWYDIADLSFDFTVDTSMATGMLNALSQAGYQARPVNYDGFPIDTGTIIADKLINTNHLPVGMFSCCVYSDYFETIKLGQTLRRVLENLEGTTAVVVVSGLSQRFFTTEIDLREDRVRSQDDDLANKKLISMITENDWAQQRDFLATYTKSVKADMGMKGLAFLEGLGLLGVDAKLQSKAYGAIYGTGAAVLTSW